MGKLDEDVIIVSGGSRGIGAQICRLLASEGAKVVVADVLDDDGQEVAAEVDGIFVHLDVTAPESWQAAVDATLSTYGHLTGLVNNAGVVGFTPVGDTSL